MNLERGEIKRLSVAVLVDHRIEVDEAARKLVRVARIVRPATVIVDPQDDQ